MRSLRLILSVALLWLFAPVLAAAQCAGENVFEALPAKDRAEIEAAAAAHPFAEGNFWQARKGSMRLTILGTYHFNDPRHEATVAAARPLIARATTVLVEAGPAEEKALLDQMARDPSAMMITSGPTLLERLPPETWERLSKALADRGIPGFMAAKLQPWYATMMLAIPPCAMLEMADPKGLDGLIIDLAVEADIPIGALEPFDTVLTIFGGMTEAEQLAMIDSSLAVEAQSEDFAFTLAETYFAGKSRLLWELMRYQSYAQPGRTRADVDAELAVMEEALMLRRNRSWIPVIEGAAAKGPAVVAFGALHLPGEEGVLNLLKTRGWIIDPLPMPAQ